MPPRFLPSRTRAYGREALSIALAMGRYLAAGDLAGARRGLTALRDLGQWIAGLPASRACQCPVCGTEAASFGPIYYYDHYRERALCYSCGAVERYRALALYLERELAGFFEGGGACSTSRPRASRDPSFPATSTTSRSTSRRRS
jgi:hypothetical protein